MEKQKKNTGITLIALVITIIVLLILAGVSIAMLTGENGIFTQARRASEETEIASEEERVNLAASGALLNDNGGKITQGNLENELEKYFDRSDFSVTAGTNDSGEEGFIVTITENVEEGRKYFVNQNGSVEEYKEPQVSELTDIYVTLYTDGTLAFSNNSQPMEGKTLEASYGNIKDEVFEMQLTENGMSLNIPWMKIDATNEEDAINQLMNQASKIKNIIITNKIVPKNTSYWFGGLMNLQKIEGIGNLDTSNVTDMSYMFYMCSSLSSIDLSRLNTSNVTDMSYMFYMCSSLSSIDLSRLNTSNVTDMNSMFTECSGLSSIDLSKLDTRNVTNMSSMFSGCSGLSSIDLSKFDTVNVTDMSTMFYECSGLGSLDLSSFNTSKVTNMRMMFDGCTGLNSIDLSSFNTSNVTDMLQMFCRCTSLESLDISSFDISKDTEIANFFDSITCKVYVKNEEIRDILKSKYQNRDIVIEVKS